eukprot:evm.model.scf_786.7 EVM.evm.TU.scf_786.7   scf_786:50237-51847(+)
MSLRPSPARPLPPPGLRPSIRLPPSRHRVAATPPDVTLDRVPLGHSDLTVPEACLGTMMFGSQLSESQAHNVMDFAADCGITFFDTAEMYPVPPDAATHGNSSRIVGAWLRRARREDFVVATKVVGHSEEHGWVLANRTEPPGGGGGPARVDGRSIKAAVEGELRRLRTDYIDVMQIHWPDRYVPLFGRKQYFAEHERDSVSFEEQAAAMGELIREGKIRHWGLSNETTFGVMEHCRAADAVGVERPISIQNSYSLLDRNFETELAEACSPRNMNIGLLPWCAAAAGALSGKYCRGKPPGSRLSIFKGIYTRFVSERSLRAIEEYVKIAEKAGISGMQLAYLFCKSRSFIPSTIIAASNNEQLEENVRAFGMRMADDVLAAINEVHLRHTNPQNSD